VASLITILFGEQSNKGRESRAIGANEAKKLNKSCSEGSSLNSIEFQSGYSNSSKQCRCSVLLVEKETGIYSLSFHNVLTLSEGGGEE
jgi:hypothetical protein